ncbi:MAG: type II toxin-antitoxin system ParD family antitoxin [Phycisphaerales bacterium]|nr:MAG: type II toxin-antitoxin system ParD family antitoxin [Phycisphaerales bacterium]
MNVSVTPELERFVQSLVASGRYHSASEVFRAGLRLLEQAERRRLLETWLLEGVEGEEQGDLPDKLRDELRSGLQAKIVEGLDALERGDVVDGDAFFTDWRTRIESAAASADSATRKHG